MHIMCGENTDQAYVDELDEIKVYSVASCSSVVVWLCHCSSCVSRELPALPSSQGTPPSTHPIRRLFRTSGKWAVIADRAESAP